MLMVTGMAVVANQDRRLALVASASDEESSSGGAWHAWQTTLNGEWSGWQSPGSPGSGAGVGPPALASNADGRLEVVVVDRADGGVWHAWQTAPNGGWSGWHPLDKPDPEIPVLLSPALARDADRHLQAFVILQDGSVWCIRQQPAGGWSGWQSLGQPGDGPAADPALAPIANADGRLALFASVVDGEGDEAIWHRQQRPTGGGWTGWSSLGVAGGGFGPTGPVAARNADGRLEVFMAAADGSVRHRWQRSPGGDWAAWSSLGSQAGGFNGIGVGANADGRLELLATLPDGTDLWRCWQSAPSNGWSAWSTDGSPTTATIERPTLGSNADGRLELFLMVPDTGGLQRLTQTAPNNGWTVRAMLPPP
jgi:hypothetical protein